jgi:hypothetical protein
MSSVFSIHNVVVICVLIISSEGLLISSLKIFGEGRRCIFA